MTTSSKFVSENRARVLLSSTDENELEKLTKDSKPSLCEVCGGPGRCVNYGAYTCQACRAFFRRHGPQYGVNQMRYSFDFLSLMSFVFSLF